MPQLFKIGSYLIYFWVQEGVSLEPVHIHISVNRPNKDSTKVWTTKAGGTVVANNNSNIPQHILNRILEIIETRTEEIIEKWVERFSEISYYC